MPFVPYYNHEFSACFLIYLTEYHLQVHYRNLNDLSFLINVFPILTKILVIVALDIDKQFDNHEHPVGRLE